MDLTTLDAASQTAAMAFVTAGAAANTVCSYRSALAYLVGWLQGRYGVRFGEAPLPAAVAVQFILDHLARTTDDGGWTHALPLVVDAKLVAAGLKGRPGALAFSAVAIPAITTGS